MNFMKRYKNKIIKGSILLFLIIMLIYPESTFAGASSGLLLWFHHVLPNLLPFIILSNLIIRLNITGQISKLFYPFVGKLFGISREGCYPVVFGFLSGIPMGAKATADLVTSNRISLQEGQFLMSMCNNASPMFILGYIAITQLQLPAIKYILFAIIYGSSILGAIIYRMLFKTDTKTTGKVQEKRPHHPVSSITSERFSFDHLDSSIMNGFEIVTRIGGYIILFSILAGIMKEAIPATGVIKAIMMGILEITTGVSQICLTNLAPESKIVLVCTLTTFGGFSCIAQTKSVLQNSRLSISSYFVVKLISAMIALLITLFYVWLFQVL